MSTVTSEIRQFLASDQQIPRATVQSWIASASDLQDLCLLYQLTDECYNRISPELGGQATCDVICRYLIECIRFDPDDQELLSRYDAASEMLAWFYHLLRHPDDCSDILSLSARAITQLFLDGDEAVRTCIETAFLEHVLERAQLRRFFADWAGDPRLRAAHMRALAWADAHPDFMSNMFNGLSDKRP